MSRKITLKPAELPLLTTDDNGDRCIWYHDRLENIYIAWYEGWPCPAAKGRLRVEKFLGEVTEAFNTKVIKKNAWEELKAWTRANMNTRTWISQQQRPKQSRRRS